MNEGSTSRLYSFNIYLKSDIEIYHRSYKKFFLILAEGLPIINIVFIFFGIIAKIFKISSGNKKLTELLFENSKIKKMKISSNQLNSFKKKSKKLDINKIDRLYLQQHILNDDKGWFSKDEKTYSHWSSNSLNGDSYSTGDKRDLMNEGSSSKFYSFNIYLKSDVVYYNRSYKKLLLIIADGLPIVNVIFIIFKLFTKIVKISSGNKKLTELLFENLQENPNKIKNGKIKVLKLNKKK